MCTLPKLAEDMPLGRIIMGLAKVAVAEGAYWYFVEAGEDSTSVPSKLISI